MASPLAAFGTVTGMVFPVLMFPACILFGLAELLIPELARCAAGGCLGSCFTLICLSILRLREHPAVDRRIPMTRRLYHTAVPLALADDVKSGINTVENLMVP